MPPVTTPGLTFGFGLGYSASAGTTSALPTLNTGSSRSKRQRSASPSPSEDGVETLQQPNVQASNAENPWSTPQQALPKRLRAGLSVGQTSPGRKSRHASTPPGHHVAAADVGKLLTSLDKSSLLTVFSRLLTTDPSLADRIRTVIPAPSLPSVEASLDEAQRTVRSASVNSSEMRPEFAWGRLRIPVADFTTTVLGLLSFFVERQHEAYHSRSSDSSPTISSSLGVRDAPHPSTTFSFLHLVTERAQSILAQTPPTPDNLSASLFSPDATNAVVVAHVSGTPKHILKVYQDALSTDKLSAVNPNMIVSQLLPTLLLHWADFVDGVSRSVNEEGRMFGADTVRGWLGGLEALTRCKHEDADQEKDEEKACRMALFTLGQRLHEQIGWLVGRHASWRASPDMEF